MRIYSAYEIMSLVSIVIRQFFLPNPFECFENAAIINLIAEPIIHLLAFSIVGRYYRRGSEPEVGSFMYLIAYAGITGFLWILGLFSFALWWDIIVLAALIVLLALVSRIKEKFWEWQN